jgi:hypothetical protein
MIKKKVVIHLNVYHIVVCLEIEKLMDSGFFFLLF